MNARGHRYLSATMRTLAVLAACAALGLLIVGASPAAAQRPSTDKHVAELARYLNGVKIAAPVVYRQLAVYPILVDDVPLLRGRWLTCDAAISRGVLVVSEKGNGSVPVVWVENLSRDEYVFIMTGEVVAGGRQTRTIRNDVVLAPGQKIDLDVFCVEARRWEGEGKFSAGSKTMLPQSIQGKLRGGSGQSEVWSEVARNNAALKAENSTGSLEAALKAAPVREKLDDVRRKIVPEIPRGTTGFVFVARGRAVGAELFGSEDLARELLPKLLDSYAVDYVLLYDPGSGRDDSGNDRVAIEFFERVCRTGSQRANTPGSGSGIRTREGGLLGDGVSFDGALAHYGVQPGQRLAPHPRPYPRPPFIYPESGHPKMNQQSPVER
jgi:hypothetical protein